MGLKMTSFTFHAMRIQYLRTICRSRAHNEALWKKLALTNQYKFQLLLGRDKNGRDCLVGPHHTHRPRPTFSHDVTVPAFSFIKHAITNLTHNFLFVFRWYFG